jgi:hypothetical protein
MSRLVCRRRSRRVSRRSLRLKNEPSPGRSADSCATASLATLPASRYPIGRHNGGRLVGDSRAVRGIEAFDAADLPDVEAVVVIDGKVTARLAPPSICETLELIGAAVEALSDALNEDAAPLAELESESRHRPADRARYEAVMDLPYRRARARAVALVGRRHIAHQPPVRARARQSKCPAGRRRSPAATRAGPDGDGDPEPAGLALGPRRHCTARDTARAESRPLVGRVAYA